MRLTFTILILAVLHVGIAEGQSRRGAMIGQGATAADLADLSSHGANLARWQINNFSGTVSNPAGNRAALVSQLQVLLSNLPAGMKVCVDLHGVPDGLLGSLAGRNVFVDFWRTFSGEFSGDSRIWGFDLLNEPSMRTSDWRRLARRTILAIRESDASRRVVVESRHGHPGTLGNLNPFSSSLGPVVYSIHFWHPLLSYNHQGIDTDGDGVPNYPTGVGRPSRAHIENIMQAVINYKNQHGVQVFVGEFGVSPYAPGRVRYLRDIIRVCETHNLPWAFHAWREAPVWDPEPQPGILNLLEGYWARN